MSTENKSHAFPLSQKSNDKPLKGVRVIDAGNMVAAPFATVLLADLGADVVKLEHPENGDGQRKLEPITKEGIPLWWKSISRNKRCVTLNLGKPEGAEIFKELCKTADVVVENYRPGTFERWGIGQDVIEQINPNIVMLRISGFGQTGPYANRAGFGRVAEAMAGLTNLIGEPDGPPMTPGYPLGDLIAGLFGAFSVMVALYNRDAKGGTGQAIDLALFESVLRLLDFDPIQYDQMNEIHRRSGNSAAYVAPSSTFQSSDGKWLTLAASTQSVWLRLAKAVDREDMTTDPRYAENPDRLERSDEVNGAIGEWIEQRTLAEVVKRFEEYEVAFSTIYDAKDMFNDAQYQAREALVRVPDSDLGEAVVQNVIPKFSKTPGSVDWLGPKMGTHNEEIFCDELGFSAEKLQALKDAKII
ncbi:MAG: CoA transferase [Rhodospirillaceae bacterium]|nr:CoA transferase [Rhodospirillaceae bacterium]MBT5458646.1 CoA transferase [Rhodospirillaceae bacterium]